MEQATRNLVSQIKAIPLPATSDGDTANQQLSQLMTDLTNTVDATKNGVAAIRDDASAETIATVGVTIAQQWQSLKNSATTAADSLRSNAVPLGRAFQKADSCQALH